MPSFPADLRGRVAIVTGAAMGMGRTLALRLAREGCHLALCDVDQGALEGVQRECEAADASLRVTAHKVDVSVREQVRAFGADVVAAHGNEVHLLFNNAGIVVPDAWDRMSEASFDKVMAVNLDGVVTMTRVFWPHLVAADAAMVVNTSSVAGFIPQAAFASTPYAVSKYAVRGFSEHLMVQAQTIAPHVKVSVVHPGAIATEIPRSNLNMSAQSVDTRYEMWQKAEGATDAEKLQHTQGEVKRFFETWGYTAEQAADMIVDGTKAGRTRIMVGWDATIMDAWVRAFPRIFNSQLGGKLVMLSAMMGRHFFLPVTALAAGAAALTFRSRL